MPTPTMSRDGVAQATLAGRVSSIFGAPLPERQLALRAGGGLAATVAWAMVDADGLPVDLTNLVAPLPGGGSAVPARLRLRDSVAGGGGTLYSFAAVAVSPPAGTLSAPLDVASLPGPGVYDAEFAVMASADPAETRVAFSNRLSLIVDRSLFGPDMGVAGPPTMAEIRLHMRDSSPGENRLLDTRMFDDAEVAACITRVVDYWNEVPPPLLRRYGTSDFPHRFLWLVGIRAGLYAMAADWYRRNHLAYQAGGVQVDDLAKADEYDRKADQGWAECKEMVKNRKVSDNIEEGYGGISSAYGRGYGRGYGWGRMLTTEVGY